MEKRTGTRKVVLLVIYGLGLAVLLGRTVYLQFPRHALLTSLGEKNRIRRITLPAARGRILDTHGRVLAEDRPSWNIELHPPAAPPPDSTLGRAARILGESPSSLRRRIMSADSRGYEPVVLAADVPFETVAVVKERSFLLPGFDVSFLPRRRHPFGALAAHLLGYTREPDPEERRQHRSRGHGFDPRQFAGKQGIEGAYDHLLWGRTGVRFVEVDATGRLVRGIDHPAERPPRPGEDVDLTLDLELQQAAEAAFPRGAVGALVAMDPASGAVLAMVSRPGFDPDEFSSRLTAGRWQQLSAPREGPSPLLDRAAAGIYPPASIFKLVTAAAVLEEGVVRPDEFLEPCTPEGLLYRGRRFRCWKPHGRLTLVQALARSCDVYFYQVGIRLGVDRIARYARSMGLGSLTGIDLPGESSGLVPDGAYYDRLLGPSGWLDGSQAINLAIGQGELLVTPLQVAALTAFFASEGDPVTPYLVQSPSTKAFPALDPRTIRIVREGMEQAVRDEEGTVRWLTSAFRDLDVAGKTGTAQNPHGEDHAWFTGYAPADEPRIVVTVLLEEAGGGSEHAAPPAFQVIQAFRDLSGGW